MHLCVYSPSFKHKQEHINTILLLGSASNLEHESFSAHTDLLHFLNGYTVYPTE